MIFHRFMDSHIHIMYDYIFHATIFLLLLFILFISCFILNRILRKEHQLISAQQFFKNNDSLWYFISEYTIIRYKTKRDMKATVSAILQKSTLSNGVLYERIWYSRIILWYSRYNNADPTF